MPRPTRDLIVIILTGTVSAVMLIAIAAMATRKAGEIPDAGREAMQMLMANMLGVVSGFVLGRETEAK